jgi:hypothetical protein
VLGADDQGLGRHRLDDTPVGARAHCEPGLRRPSSSTRTLARRGATTDSNAGAGAVGTGDRET